MSIQPVGQGAGEIFRLASGISGKSKLMNKKEVGLEVVERSQKQPVRGLGNDQSGEKYADRIGRYAEDTFRAIYEKGKE